MSIENMNRIEAVLFSSGKKVELSDIKKICKIKDEEEIRQAIAKLKERYEHSSVMIVDEKDAWKMTVRERYLHFIKKIVTDTELSKTVMETLAVVAWRNPAFQSDIIKIRTNKAYDHLKELEDAGFIDSIKHGRTRLIKLTKKFYDYFDIEGDKDIKEVFGKKISKELIKKAEEKIAEETGPEEMLDPEDEELQIKKEDSKDIPKTEIVDIPEKEEREEGEEILREIEEDLDKEDEEPSQIAGEIKIIQDEPTDVDDDATEETEVYIGSKEKKG